MHRIAVSLVIASSLAACSWSGTIGQKMEATIAPDTVSLADRCGEIMKAAMPFAQLDLGDRSSRSPDVRTIVAQVAATRTDLPNDVAGERDLAAECTFVNNVMTAFRWTKGGPPPPPEGDQGRPSSEAPPASAPPAGAPSAGAPPAGSPPQGGKAPPFH